MFKYLLDDSLIEVTAWMRSLAFTGSWKVDFLCNMLGNLRIFFLPCIFFLFFFSFFSWYHGSISKPFVPLVVPYNQASLFATFTPQKVR